jgi:hypothetical protein
MKSGAASAKLQTKGRKPSKPAKTGFPSCVEHVVRVTHTKVVRNLRSSCGSLQQFLIESADVVQGSTLKNQLHPLLSQQE